MRKKKKYEVPSLEMLELTSLVLLADSATGNGGGNLGDNENDDDFNFDD